jgi:hypothetical protein
MRRPEGVKRAPSNGRRYYRAELGSYHPVAVESDPRANVDQNGIEIFFGLLLKRWNKFLPPKPPTNYSWDTRLVEQFKLEDASSETLGVTVFESWVTKRHGRKNAVRWTSEDKNRIKQRLDDEIARLGITRTDLKAELTEIIPVGQAGHQKGRQVAALIEPRSRAAELLIAEHEVVMGYLQQFMPEIAHPYEYVPHLTIGYLEPNLTSPKQRRQSMRMAQDLLPVTVQMEPLRLTAKHEMQV